MENPALCRILKKLLNNINIWFFLHKKEYYVSKMTFLSKEQKENLLTNEIRPSPTGVAGAEPIPKKKHQDTWYETDIDNNYTKDWGPE